VRRIRGFSLVEVLVAIAILGILSVALVSLLPSLTRNTRASSVDSAQNQQVLTIFERIGVDWTNRTAFGAERLSDGRSLDDFVAAETGGACTVDVQDPSAERKRVIVTCAAQDGLPERSLRAEFGDPGESGASGG
jgi:uncharacterized protein (TIGR02598 family)